MKKVVKFGGSSLASAEQFKKVGNIIKSDPDRKYVIPSAPGKRFAKDVKVTDMLYHCYETAMTETDFRGLLEQIKARYNEIIQGLSLDMSLDDEFKTIETAFKNKEGIDYAASRGEYLNGLVMAKYLDYEFIDPVKYIFFREDGQLDQEKTYNTLGRKLNKVERAVIPGFYGCGADGKVQTFSRGGSDVTGSVVAKAVLADVYENWTDVSGVLVADPRIIENPKPFHTGTFNDKGSLVLRRIRISDINRNALRTHRENRIFVKNAGSHIRKLPQFFISYCMNRF